MSQLIEQSRAGHRLWRRPVIRILLSVLAATDSVDIA